MSGIRLEELLSAALDDALSDDERDELEELARETGNDGQLAAEYRRLNALLCGMAKHSPPEGLHERILDSVSLPTGRETSKVHWLRRTAVSPVARYGLATAAGVLLTVFVHDRIPMPGMDVTPADMVGTMAPDGQRGTRAILASHRYASSEGSGQIMLTEQAGRLQLDIALDSANGLEVMVDFSSSALAVAGLAPVDGAIGDIELETDRLQLRGHGNRRVSVLLRDATSGRAGDKSRIGLAFISDGQLLEEAWLEPRLPSEKEPD